MAQVLVYFILATVLAGAAIASKVGASSPSPTQAPQKMPQIARKLGAPPPRQSSHHSNTKESQSHPAEETSTTPTTSSAEEATKESKSEGEHHRPFDKSVAGGGVILGGLATTFLVAIFCYIRATRRHSKAATASESPAHHQLP